MTPLSRTVTQWRGDLAKIRNIIDAIRADINLDKVHADRAVLSLERAYSALAAALETKKRR